MAASETLCRRQIAPPSDYTPLHKALVYSTLPEVGSMMRITLAGITRARAPLESICFRIIDHLPCLPPLTPLSRPRANAYLRGGKIPTRDPSNARPPGTPRVDFGIMCAEPPKTESR